MSRGGQDHDHRHGLAAGVVCALVTAGAIAGGGVAVARTEEEPHARTASKPRCLWAKRDCYPPARLWYRVSVRLEAEQNANLDRPPTDTFSGETQRHRVSERWTFRSNHAIRLTLLCDEVDERERPFLDKQRIDGRRKTIGGCANKRPGHRPTLRFAATAAGEVTSMTRTETFGPTEALRPGGGFRRCEGRSETDTLVSSQPLAGTISTPDSQTTGLVIDAPAAAPFATVHNTKSAYSCDENGTLTATEARAFESQFGHTDVLGGDPREGIFASRVGLWFALNTFLRFTARPAKFGGVYIIQKRVTQPELKPETFLPPPPGLAGNTSAKDYTYTIRLEPCPSKGRDVQHC